MSKSVNFAEWLDHHGLEWQDALCVNVATDGLDPDKNHLLGVGIQAPDEDPEYVYVAGGFPSEAEEFNGISAKYYIQRRLGAKRARELLADSFIGAPFLVVNNRVFLERWVLQNEPPLSLLQEFPLFDVVEYVKFLESGDRLYFSTGTDIDEITTLIRHNIRDMQYHGGFSFPAVYARRTGLEAADTGVIFESRTEELTRLYKALLWA